MKGPLQAVEVSYFVHATEDSNRVAAKIKSALSLETEPEQENLTGHFGYTIIHVRYHLTGGAADSFAGRLAAGLDAAVRKTIRETLDESVDEHCALYLRLDKQQLMGGRIELGTRDAVRVKIKPRLFQVRGGIDGFYREVLRLDD